MTIFTAGMFHKYDIAISVAEEDLVVAEQIAAALKERRVRYFLYTEHRAEFFGRNLFEIILDSFGRRARYVLMIASNTFLHTYWQSIEWRIVNMRKGRLRILPLMLEGAVMDKSAQHVVFENWKNNPEEIADLIAKKLRNEAIRRKWYRALALLFIATATGIILLMQARQNSLSYVPGPGNSVSVSLGAKLDSVKLDSFFITPTEVTMAQYGKYCLSQGKTLPPQPYYSGKGSYPVVNITWQEAFAFCQWAGGRLPREAEWEYAAGGGLPAIYSGGNNAGKVAVYRCLNPKAVATRDHNQFGLYDMTGNAAEWCADWFDSRHEQKVVRGGSYKSSVYELRITIRDKEYPDSARPYIGFRVVWDRKKSI